MVKLGRPRKEGSQTILKSANWRLVIPNLQQYVDSTPRQLMNLKYQVLQKLKQYQKKYQLRYYHIALERHANGVPHLDILLIYPKSVQHRLTHFDYLLKHGNITTYRKLNAAILNYGKKQDKEALSNLPEDKVLPSGQVVNQIIQIQQLKKDPYFYLQKQMLKDPLHFNLEQYVRKHNLDPYITSWSSLKTKLKDMQTAAANLLLKNKPGFKLITRQLIQSQLTSDQLKKYDSWSGYQIIVNKLNQMILLKGKRKMKTLNLLISGPPNVGKTSLFHNPNHQPHEHCVQDFCSLYPMGMSQWFPKYQPGVYHMILWNQAKLTSYSYDTILKLLEGSHMDLPNKGSVSRKVDNPLVIMTSNLTLQQMIQQKFGYNKDYVTMAKANLAVRVQNVVIPKGYNLFLLQKLFL